MTNNSYEPSCDYLPEYTQMPIQHVWVTSCRNLILGTALAASILGTEVNWDDREVINEKVGTYIKADDAYKENLRIYEEIAEEFNKQVSDERYQAVMNEIRATILSYNALANNWDGYGAIPLGVQSAAMAMSLLDFLSPAAIKQIDDCFPESNGTISLQWKNQYSERVSVNIGAEFMSYYVKLDGEDTEYYSSIEINEQSGLQLSKKIESVICA